MIAKRIDIIKRQLAALKELAELTHTKMVIASASCLIATEVHFQKLNKLNAEYLDLDAELQLLQAIPKVDTHIIEDQAVS